MKFKANKKLGLDKKTIAQLDLSQMSEMNGGAKSCSQPATQSCPGVCTYTCPLPTWATKN